VRRENGKEGRRTGDGVLVPTVRDALSPPARYAMHAAEVPTVRQRHGPGTLDVSQGVGFLVTTTLTSHPAVESQTEHLYSDA